MKDETQVNLKNPENTKENKMKNDDSKLTEPFKKQAQEGYESLKQSAGGMYEQMHHTAEQIVKGAKTSAKDATDCFEEQAVKLIKQVRRKPLTSLLIAGGIGFVLSTLLRK